MNLLPATVAERDGKVLATGDGWELALAATAGDIVLGARHSSLILHEAETPGCIPARIYTVEPTGDLTYAHVMVGDQTFVISTDPQRKIAADQPVWIEFDQDRLHIFDARTEQRIAPG